MEISKGRIKAHADGLEKISDVKKLQARGKLNLDQIGAGQIIHGDSIKVLENGPSNWADLCFADPPFNIGYLYHDYKDKKDVQEYVKWSERWMAAVHRALKPTGSFFLAIGDEFAADLCYVARRKIGFHMRNWIIWHYTFGQQTVKKFAKSHTHILYFSKSDPKENLSMVTFNADAIRVKSARQLIYGDLRANPKGRVPDDTWFLRPQEATIVEPSYQKMVEHEADPIDFFDPRSDTWYVPRLCGTFKEREGWHGCQMPISVLDRVIKSASNPGDIVLDPFSGSGTTAVSAALLGRKYVGIDQSDEYVKFGRERVKHALQHMPMPAVDGNAATGVNHKSLFSMDRNSRVQTPTDAFGRPRVKRGKRAAKEVVEDVEIEV